MSKHVKRPRPTTPSSYKRGRIAGVFWDPKEVIDVPNWDGTFRQQLKGPFNWYKVHGVAIVRMNKSDRRLMKRIEREKKKKKASLLEQSATSNREVTIDEEAARISGEVPV